MANMLIRTSNLRKYRLAFVVRVVLFVGIPLVYFASKSFEEEDTSDLLYKGSQQNEIYSQ